MATLPNLTTWLCGKGWRPDLIPYRVGLPSRYLRGHRQTRAGSSDWVWSIQSPSQDRMLRGLVCSIIPPRSTSAARTAGPTLKYRASVFNSDDFTTQGYISMDAPIFSPGPTLWMPPPPSPGQFLWMPLPPLPGLFIPMAPPPTSGLILWMPPPPSSGQWNISQ